MENAARLFDLILPLVPRYGIQNSFRSRPLLWHGHDRVDSLESLFLSIVHLFRAWLLLLLLVASEGRGADDPRRVLSGEIDRNNDIFVLRIAKEEEEERAEPTEENGKGTRVGLS